MKIKLKRTGGVAGMTRQWEIDFSTLPSAKAAEFGKLLTAANFFALGANLVSPSQSRDQFCYELTVDEEDKTHTVRCSEERLPECFQACLDWIMRK